MYPSSEQAVVDGTRRYIKKAGTVLVFTKFQRGAINGTLDANLTECIALGKTQNIQLIVTNVDGRTLKPDEREELDGYDLSMLKDAEDLHMSLKAKEAKIIEEKDDARRSKKWEMYGELEDSLEEISIKIEVAAAKVSQTIVEIKCRGFEREVKDKLRKLDR